MHKMLTMLSIWSRFPILVFLVCAPLAGVGFAVAQNPGAAAGTLTGLLALLTISFCSERVILRKFSGTRELPMGLAKSLEYGMAGLADLEELRPKLAVFPSSAPNAVVVRELGSPGTLLLSQGLLALLSEPELRSILRLCAVELRSPGIRIRSLSAVLALWVLELAPRNWVETILTGRRIPKPNSKNSLGPFSAMLFLLLFPAARSFLALSRRSSHFTVLLVNARQGPGAEPAYHWGRICSGALQRMSQTLTTSNVTENPGAAYLHVLVPWSQRTLFPIA